MRTRTIGTVWMLTALLALPAWADDAKKASAKDQLEATYTKGADWLVKQQAASGAWIDQGGNDDVGITALALNGLVNAPEAVRAKYAKQITAGIDYLLKNAQENGSIMEPAKMPPLANYKTALALLALVNCGDKRAEPVVQKARKFLEGTQFCETFGNIKQDDRNYGGWAYSDHLDELHEPDADMSNAQFTLEALNKAGLPKDSEVVKRAQRFLNRCQNRSESNDMAETLGKQEIKVQNDGGFIYHPLSSKAGLVELPGGGKGMVSYGSMTYAGLKSFICAYVDKQDPRVQAVYGWIKTHWTLDENPGLRTDADPKLGQQGWYYYFHTLAKALEAYGEKTLPDAKGASHNWANELSAKLGSLQQEDGSWVNTVPRWWEDYRPLVTSYVLMALNAARGSIVE